MEQMPRFKKVFIQRDYGSGTSVKFQTNFPPELDGLIEQDSFHYLVNHINAMYAQGESMSSRTFCESCCACISSYMLYLCIEPYYDKCSRKVGDFIEEQNDLRWKRRGLTVTDPLERGLRVIEITINLDKIPANHHQNTSSGNGAASGVSGTSPGKGTGSTVVPSSAGAVTSSGSVVPMAAPTSAPGTATAMANNGTISSPPVTAPSSGQSITLTPAIKVSK